MSTKLKPYLRRTHLLASPNQPWYNLEQEEFKTNTYLHLLVLQLSSWKWRLKFELTIKEILFKQSSCKGHIQDGRRPKYPWPTTSPKVSTYYHFVKQMFILPLLSVFIYPLTTRPRDALYPRAGIGIIPLPSYPLSASHKSLNTKSRDELTRPWKRREVFL